MGELSDGLNLRFNKFLSVVFRAIASFKEIDPNIESFEINGIWKAFNIRGLDWRS